MNKIKTLNKNEINTISGGGLTADIFGLIGAAAGLIICAYLRC